MTFANDLFWPELHPDLMPSAFAHYAQLLLAEGDSWFAWGYLGLNTAPNLLNRLQFAKPTATLNYAYSGHTIGDMAGMAISAGFMQEMSARKFDAILLSGGGNDLFQAIKEGNIIGKPGSGADPNDPASYVDAGDLAALKNYVTLNYLQILSWRQLPTSLNKTTPVLLHTYDIPMPRPAPALAYGQPAAGPWLEPALIAAGAPPALYFKIIERIARDLLDCIRALHDPAAGIHVVDTSAAPGTLAPAAAGSSGSNADWENEIHPNGAGYDKLAAKLNQRLAALGVA